MARPDFKSNGDFITMLLTDELFAGKDEEIADECMTFLGAAT